MELYAATPLETTSDFGSGCHGADGRTAARPLVAGGVIPPTNPPEKRPAFAGLFVIEWQHDGQKHSGILHANCVM